MYCWKLDLDISSEVCIDVRVVSLLFKCCGRLAMSLDASSTSLAPAMGKVSGFWAGGKGRFKSWTGAVVLQAPAMANYLFKASFFIKLFPCNSMPDWCEFTFDE